MKKLPLFCLLGFLFFTRGLFAIPVQYESLRGINAAEARLILLSTAESCLGVPYRYAGVDRGGLDCSGLVYLSFRDGLGLAIPRTSGGIYDWAEKIPDSALEPGDLVFFVTTGAGISHLGIYAGDGRFIHSASAGPRTGVIYSRLDESYWKRTYRGAGRALPWDNETARIMAASRSRGEEVRPALPETGGKPPAVHQGPEGSAPPSAPPPLWKESGYFTGAGAVFTWGGFIEGAPSVFRGFSTLFTAGYKWPAYRAALELRPEWDRALGVFRLPFTLSVGTDTIQVFVGPAYTFGEPGLDLSDGERRYRGGGAWTWEGGFSAALPPIPIGRGALFLLGEIAWQPYHWEDGESFSFAPDITANMRISTGLRYLWRLGE